MYLTRNTPEPFQRWMIIESRAEGRVLLSRKQDSFVPSVSRIPCIEKILYREYRVKVAKQCEERRIS